jgi:hypothetical protein
MSHESPGPRVYHGGLFEFLQKIAEKFESKDNSPVSMTPAISEQIFEVGSFFIFLRCYWVAVYTHIMIVYLLVMFNLRCRQVNFVASVSLSVSLTPSDTDIAGNNNAGDNVSPVSLSPVNSLSPVSIPPAKNSKLRISPQIFIKPEMIPKTYLEARGHLIKKVENLVSDSL